MVLSRYRFCYNFIVGKSIRLKLMKSKRFYNNTIKNLEIGTYTKVLFNGLIGKHAKYHGKKMMEYKTSIVGSINAERSGTIQFGKPVFANIKEARDKTGADATIIFVPAPFATQAIYEAIDVEIPLIICITQGIPQYDMVKVKARLLQQNKTRLLGPDSNGMVRVGECQLGFFPSNIQKPGQIAIVSRSVSLIYEVIFQTTVEGLGQTYCIGVGGDPFNGTDFIDCMKIFLEDDKTKGIIIIGEIGGTAEQDVATFLKENNTGPNAKAIVSFIAGKSAPPGRQMGHTGAIILNGEGTAREKIQSLHAAGILVSESPATIGKCMIQALKR